MATINNPNVNIHVSISSVTIFIPPLHRAKTFRPPLYKTLAALRGIFYHKIPYSSIFYYHLFALIVNMNYCSLLPTFAWRRTGRRGRRPLQKQGAENDAPTLVVFILFRSWLCRAIVRKRHRYRCLFLHARWH